MTDQQTDRPTDRLTKRGVESRSTRLKSILKKGHKIRGPRENFDHKIQYDGSNDDLDWRIDFKYLKFHLYYKIFEI